MSIDSSRMPAPEQGAPGHDEPYTWGLAPSMYVSPRQVARMIVFRSRLDDRRTLRDRTMLLPSRREIPQ
jgi:hypothetical protein